MDKAALTRLHWRKAFVQLGELTLVCLLLDYSTVFLWVLFSKHWNVIIDSLIWSYGIHLDHLCNHRFLEWRWCYQIVFVPLLHRAVSGTVGLLYTFTVCVCVFIWQLPVWGFFLFLLSDLNGSLGSEPARVCLGLFFHKPFSELVWLSWVPFGMGICFFVWWNISDRVGKPQIQCATF